MHRKAKGKNLKIKDHDAVRRRGSTASRAITPPSLYRLVREGRPLSELKKKINRRDINAKDERGQTLLHLACLRSSPDMELIKFLISKKADVNASDSSGWTSLHCICSASSSGEGIQFLVNEGADVKACNKDGTTPIHYFVRHSPSSKELKVFEETLDFMLERGAYINCQNKHGETPLHGACLRGGLQVFILLLNRKADINITNKYGETILHYAVMASQKKMVEMMLELGMDPKGGSGINGTAIDVAKNAGMTDIYDLLCKSIPSSASGAGPKDPSSSSGAARGSIAPHGSASEDEALNELKLIMRNEGRIHWAIDFNELDVKDRIGKGAFGAVYRAKWRGTVVAMKKIHAGAMAKKEKDIFFQEIHTISKLRHPNIILFLGACLEEPNICFITEYMPKGDLHMVLTAEPDLPWPLKISMAMDGARGMLYLHMCSPPVVHRDLKSLNLLVDNTYNVKVTDFGISKSLENTLETANSKMGTLNWLAPEILSSKPYSPAADVYSFGIILWEILTQKTPFEGMHNVAILNALARGEGPKIPDTCEPNYALLMKDCWRTDPKDRPGMMEVLERLEECYAEITMEEKANIFRLVGVGVINAARTIQEVYTQSSEHNTNRSSRSHRSSSPSLGNRSNDPELRPAEVKEDSKGSTESSDEEEEILATSRDAKMLEHEEEILHDSEEEIRSPREVEIRSRPKGKSQQSPQKEERVTTRLHSIDTFWDSEETNSDSLHDSSGKRKGGGSDKRDNKSDKKDKKDRKEKKKKSKKRSDSKGSNSGKKGLGKKKSSDSGMKTKKKKRNKSKASSTPADE